MVLRSAQDKKREDLRFIYILVLLLLFILINLAFIYFK